MKGEKRMNARIAEGSRAVTAYKNCDRAIDCMNMARKLLKTAFENMEGYPAGLVEDTIVGLDALLETEEGVVGVMGSLEAAKNEYLAWLANPQER